MTHIEDENWFLIIIQNTLNTLINRGKGKLKLQNLIMILCPNKAS